jgi:hypothetical protein
MCCLADKHLDPKSLAAKKGVSIIVQKEDFLRPDSGSTGNWQLKHRHLYERLPAMLTRYDFSLSGTAVHMMPYCGDPAIDAVRCVGGHNARNQLAFPRALGKARDSHAVWIVRKTRTL